MYQFHLRKYFTDFYQNSYSRIGARRNTAFLILGSTKFLFLVLHHPQTMKRLAIPTQVIRAFPQTFRHLQQQRHLKLVLNRVLANTLTLIILPSHGAVKNHKEKRMTSKYAVISRYVCATTGAFKKKKSSMYCIFRVCVCDLSRPECKVHAPYHVVICGLTGSVQFPVLSHKWHDFRGRGGELLNTKCVSYLYLYKLSVHAHIISTNIR